MNASRIFRNFLNVSQTTEDLPLDQAISPEETTQIIGYMNFHFGLDEHVTRAMFGTPGLIPEAFREQYDPDVRIGDILKTDVANFLDAVSKTEVQPMTELDFLKDLEEPVLVTKPAVVVNQTLRLTKKFKGK